MDFFVYDVHNFHTVKIILDVVSIERVIYINHIDIDDGIKNVIKNYDLELILKVFYPTITCLMKIQELC